MHSSAALTTLRTWRPRTVWTIPAVGTEAHYWQQAYLGYLYEPEIEPRTGSPKHFEQVAFERWLDANPNGTTLLLDTIDVYMGAVHAAMAATSK